MATAVTLKATEIAAIREGDSPGQYYNYSLGSFSESQIVYGDAWVIDNVCYNFIKFAAFPEEYKQKRAVNRKLYVYVKAVLDKGREIDILQLQLRGGALPENKRIDGLSHQEDIDWAKELAEKQDVWGDTIITEDFEGWTEAAIRQSGIVNGICYAYERAFGTVYEESFFTIILYTWGFREGKEPYIYAEIEDATVSVKAKHEEIFVNDRVDFPVEWEIVTDAIGGASAFKITEGSVMEWMTPEGETKTIPIQEEAESCIVPAGMLQQKARMQYRFILNLDNGEQVTSEWATLTTIDSPAIAQVISPNSVYVDGTVDQPFTWEHRTEMGTPQLMAELQYSTDSGGTWAPLATVEDEKQTAIIPANTLPPGTIEWRVRTYNSDNEPSEWSASASVIIRAAPLAPIILPLQKSPRPLVQWQGTDQQAFQIVAGSYDSGHVYGTAKQFKIPAFLPDGRIEIAVRIQNSFGLWSQWGTAETTISNQPPGNVSLVVGLENNAAILSWKELPIKADYYVHRDGVPIAKTARGGYSDHLTVGPHEYTVLAVDETDNYAVSNPVHHETIVRGAVLGLLPEPEWLALKCRRGGRPTHNMSIQPVVAYHHYAGRTLPVADVSPFRTVTDDFSFTVLDGDALDRLDAMTGKLVMYKDGDGRIVVGILERLYVGVRRRSDVEFTIHRTDWSEEIEYTV